MQAETPDIVEKTFAFSGINFVWRRSLCIESMF